MPDTQRASHPYNSNILERNVFLIRNEHEVQNEPGIIQNCQFVATDLFGLIQTREPELS